MCMDEKQRCAQLFIIVHLCVSAAGEFWYNLDMKLSRIVDWLDRVLDVKAFSDVSNNGVQIARRGDVAR